MRRTAPFDKIMKVFFFLLLSVLCVQGATIDIPDTQYHFEYDSKAWDFLPDSTQTKGLWAFSDHLLFLGASIILLDFGTSDAIEAKDMAKSMNEGYDKIEDVKPIGDFKTLKLTNFEREENPVALLRNRKEICPFSFCGRRFFGDGLTRINGSVVSQWTQEEKMTEPKPSSESSAKIADRLPACPASPGCHFHGHRHPQHSTICIRCALESKIDPSLMNNHGPSLAARPAQSCGASAISRGKFKASAADKFHRGFSLKFGIESRR